MANPRNPKPKEAEVTDSDTDTLTEAPVNENPASTTEAPAATNGDTAAKAPAEPKPDHEGNLFAAITTFATDNDVTKLQEVYRTVPAAARGKVQGVAMKRAMAEGGVDLEILGNVLDAFNKLPTATKVSRTKVEIDPSVAGGVKLVALMKSYEAVRAALPNGDEAHAQAQAWFADGIPKEHADHVTRITEGAVKLLDRGGRGGSGVREQKTEQLKDLIERGVLTPGIELTGANDAKAILHEDGGLTTLGEKHGNPSAAARAHRTNKDGKPTSTNGWDFWQHEGQSIGSLRIK